MAPEIARTKDVDNEVLCKNITELILRVSARAIKKAYAEQVIMVSCDVGRRVRILSRPMLWQNMLRRVLESLDSEGCPVCQYTHMQTTLAAHMVDMTPSALCVLIMETVRKLQQELQAKISGRKTGDAVIFMERTGTSTPRRCKFVGRVSPLGGARAQWRICGRLRVLVDARCAVSVQLQGQYGSYWSLLQVHFFFLPALFTLGNLDFILRASTQGDDKWRCVRRKWLNKKALWHIVGNMIGGLENVIDTSCSVSVLCVTCRDVRSRGRGNCRV